MKRKYFLTMLCAVLGALCFIFSSCSTDEEDGNEINGSLKINGENYQVEDATISDGVSNEDVFVGRMFEAKLKGKDGFYHFSMEYIYYEGGSYSFNLIEGDITEYINVESFRYITSVSFSTYDYVSGKVFLTHDENIVTLDFKDYTFKNDKGSTFVVNGSAKYID